MQLVIFPDNRLRQKCEPVTEFDDGLRRTLITMATRMVEWKGIGLAAPQCGIMKRIFVALVSGSIRVFVNPEIEDAGEGTNVMAEGCLSMPGLSVEVERPAAVTVKASDGRGRKFEHKYRGIVARCVQHEFDHLEGTVMTDRLEKIDYRMAIQRIWDFKTRAAR